MSFTTDKVTFALLTYAFIEKHGNEDTESTMGFHSPVKTKNCSTCGTGELGYIDRDGYERCACNDHDKVNSLHKTYLDCLIYYNNFNNVPFFNDFTNIQLEFIAKLWGGDKYNDDYLKSVVTVMKKNMKEIKEKFHFPSIFEKNCGKNVNSICIKNQCHEFWERLNRSEEEEKEEDLIMEEKYYYCTFCNRVLAKTKSHVSETDCFNASQAFFTNDEMDLLECFEDGKLYRALACAFFTAEKDPVTKETFKLVAEELFDNKDVVDNNKIRVYARKSLNVKPREQLVHPIKFSKYEIVCYVDAERFIDKLVQKDSSKRMKLQ